jgi:hypothetical protein
MNNSDMSPVEFCDYLKGLDTAHGKIYCLNFLTSTQGLSLPDALFFYDCFIKV